jgi:ABC-type lipoprotein release transport system permease subunit
MLAMPLAYAAARGLAALLFGVRPGDPAIYAAAAAVALVMTIAGSLYPAVRAAGVDPARTTRAE